VHDAVLAYRRQLVRLIEGSPNRRVACRQAGIHHSTFYRWRRDGLEGIDHPVGRSRSWADRHVEQRIVAAALGSPALGPLQVTGELARQGVTVSASRVYRTLVRHRLNTRRLRYLLLAAHREPPRMIRPPQTWIGSLDATVPGDLVQMDCFYVGTFKETRLGAGKTRPGVIWQYTAIDVASSWIWAELWATGANPSPAITSALAHRVAADLNGWGWTWKTLSTDNGNEFRADQFTSTVTGLGVDHRFIRAGRPQSNGKVERAQGTLLEEFYQPALIGYAQPSITGLRRDLDRYLGYYNWQRAHHGKWNQGQPPATIIKPATKLIP